MCKVNTYGLAGDGTGMTRFYLSFLITTFKPKPQNPVVDYVINFINHDSISTSACSAITCLIEAGHRVGLSMSKPA